MLSASVWLLVLPACDSPGKAEPQGVESGRHSGIVDSGTGGESAESSPSETALDSTRESAADTSGDTGEVAPAGDLDAGGSSVIVYGDGEDSFLGRGPSADIDGDGATDLVLNSSADDAVHVLTGPVSPGAHTVAEAALRIAGGIVRAGPVLSEHALLVGEWVDGTTDTVVVPLPVTTDVDVGALTGRWSDGGGPGAVGDATGDGVVDLLLIDSSSDLEADEAGAAWLAEGPFETGGSADDARALVYDTRAGAQMGIARALADVDGDGVDDVVLGAPEYVRARYLGEGAGRVVVATDAPAGALSAADLIEISGSSFYSCFGWSVSSADIDGDGYADLLVGGWGVDTVYVIPGPILASSSALDATSTLLDPIRPDTGLGSTLSPAADVDGDGAADIAIGAFEFPDRGELNSDGAVWLAYGPLIGTVSLEDGVNARLFATAQGDDALGLNALALDDFDDDGVPDLGASVPQYDTAYSDAGAVFLLSGVFF